MFLEKFQSRKNVVNDVFYSEYSEKEYLKNDTIIFLEDISDFNNHVTERIIWKFNSKNKITIAEYNSETEPPTLKYNLELLKLKIKITKDKNRLNLILLKNGIVMDKFRILNLMELDNNKRKLTLLRVK